MSEALTLETIIGFLLETPMFKFLDPEELTDIVRIMQINPVREGAYLMREGQAGNAWYVIFEGNAEVVKTEGDTEIKLVDLGPRDVVGEMAVLDDAPRSASVRASTDMKVFTFPRDAFVALLADDNLAAYKLVHQIARVLVARQRRANDELVLPDETSA